MDIRNKTGKPIRIPLAGGKRLFLKGGGMGQISPKAAEHPPIRALLDEGVIEIQGVMPKNRSSGGESSADAGAGEDRPASGAAEPSEDQ